MLTISACSSSNREHLDNISNNNVIVTSEHFQRLKTLTSWNIAGKLGVISPEQRNSVYINWQQTGRDTDIRMTNILGVQLARVTDNKTGATLESDGKLVSDDTAEGLIFRATSWYLPVSQLKSWIKGLPSDLDNVEIYDSGLIKTIQANCNTCDEWVISYDNYKKVRDIWLPHKIRLSNDTQNTRLIFTISKWTHEDL